MKKEYIKPTILLVELQNQFQMLAGRLNDEGIEEDIQTEEEVYEGW